ncbi:hypothetical protein KA082_01675 [Candidatus Woesebacteria bacterium]|nr:hypothetical protein [Candidatus Woesebacteria bacterium]
MKVFTTTLQKIYSRVFSVFVLMLAVASATPAYAVDLGIGKIAPPPGVDKIQAKSGADIGLIFFLSNMIKLFTVVCGIYAVFNIFLAATNFISSSADASATEKAKNQITNAVIGLFLIVMAFTFTGVAGLLFFGDAAIFLNPTIKPM